MAKILGTVISVELETDVKKQAGGSYRGWELVYKTSDGEVRSLAKPVTSLRYNAKLKEGLASLAGGDQFTAETEKNPQGFLDVKSIVKGWDETASAPSAPASTSSGTVPSKPAGNNYQASSYPTADERAKTQNHIIRQSSLAQAVATLAVGAKALKPDEVLAVAEQYVDWVKEEVKDKAKPKAKEKPVTGSLDDMEDDVPY